MTGPMEGAIFLYMWLGFLLLMMVCTAGFFLWALRRGQFSRQDRARYLPLQAAIPKENGAEPGVPEVRS